MRSCNWYCRKELVMGVEGVNEPGYFWLKAQETWTMRPTEKVCLVVLWVLSSVVPGESRASVGADCFVPCPPSVAPRRL